MRSSVNAFAGGFEIDCSHNLSIIKHTMYERNVSMTSDLLGTGHCGVPSVIMAVIASLSCVIYSKHCYNYTGLIPLCVGRCVVMVLAHRIPSSPPLENRCWCWEDSSESIKGM